MYVHIDICTHICYMLDIILAINAIDGHALTPGVSVSDGYSGGCVPPHQSNTLVRLK